MQNNFVEYFDTISKPTYASVRKYTTILPTRFDHWGGHLQGGELQSRYIYIYTWKYYTWFCTNAITL
jgi:hypothetical protein